MTLHKVYHICGKDENWVEHHPKRSLGFLPVLTRPDDSQQREDCPECRFIVGHYYTPKQALRLLFPKPSQFSDWDAVEAVRINEQAKEVSRQGFCHWCREKGVVVRLLVDLDRTVTGVGYCCSPRLSALERQKEWQIRHKVIPAVCGATVIAIRWLLPWFRQWVSAV